MAICLERKFWRNEKLNLNQKKVIADVLVNMSVVLISIVIISQIFMEKQFDQYYLQLGIIGFIISLSMIYSSIYILKNK